MLHIDSEAYQPDDAALLLRATEKVVRAIAGNGDAQAHRTRAARAVLKVAKAGYGRSGDHRLDTDDLAEAAITRCHADR